MSILESILIFIHFVSAAILAVLTCFVIHYSVWWYKLDNSIVKSELPLKRLKDEKEFADRVNSYSDDYIEKPDDIYELSTKIEREKKQRDECVYSIRKYGVPVLLLKVLIDFFVQLKEVFY